MSSQTVKHAELDVLVKKDIHNRLMKDSLLKTTQIGSFDKRRFIKYIGKVTEPAISLIDDQIERFLFGNKLNSPIKQEETVISDEP